MIDEKLEREILAELLSWIEQDAASRVMLARLLRGEFAAKTESRFDQLLEKLRCDREEQDRKWEEMRQEFQRAHAAIGKLDRKVAAMGARWGFSSGRSFRNGLKSILEQTLGVEVHNVIEFDETGEVFGCPEQIELDVVIKNGRLLILELKSSMSRSDVYAFERRACFYEKRHGWHADRPIIISPMADDRAKQTAAQPDVEGHLEKPSRAAGGQGARSAATAAYQVDRRGSEHRAAQPSGRTAGFRGAVYSDAEDVQ